MLFLDGLGLLGELGLLGVELLGLVVLDVLLLFVELELGEELDGEDELLLPVWLLALKVTNVKSNLRPWVPFR